MVPLCRGGRLCPPIAGLPPLSVGRDPCVPPHDMHVFLPAGHAGPALQGTGRVRADRVVRPYSGSRSRAKRDVVPQGHLFRCAPLRDAVPYGWITHLPRRAGPACPAAGYAFFSGTHGSRPTEKTDSRKNNAAPLAGRRAFSVHVWHRRRRVIFAAFTSGNREFG